MNWFYLVSGVLSLVLLAYLFVALLKPEIFE
jgi:K+-transporting ATPase KdpF subunit